MFTRRRTGAYTRRKNENVYGPNCESARNKSLRASSYKCNRNTPAGPAKKPTTKLAPSMKGEAA